ncbi:MAG: GNAT family N-acetyltransferase [Proteobacteria bacterium]|nr:MAG: GNAT family N-acetyltransferase [Pseudomonadota bacterium]
MKSVSPPESKHALDIDGLRAPDVTFWTMRDDGELVGCAALKALDSAHAEIKSMRTSAEHRGRGVGAALLAHLLSEARSRGFRRVSLETGSMGYFAPARALYLKFGFGYCEPFAGYKHDPHSVFMSKAL